MESSHELATNSHKPADEAIKFAKDLTRLNHDIKTTKEPLNFTKLTASLRDLSLSPYPDVLLTFHH